MKKTSLFKFLSTILAFLLIVCSISGLLLVPSLTGKIFCSVLGFLGFLLTACIYAASRAETIQMADTLEETLLAAEQDRIPDESAFNGEYLTHRLCLRAVRLARAARSREQAQEESRVRLQSTVSDLAHQLRAPVANLTLYADTLAEGDLPPEKQAEFLSVLSGQARKLEFLVDALVKTGRLETGVIQMKPRYLNLKSTLEQAASLIRPMAAEKGLSFALDCPEELMLPHDSKWTTEAVFNLLDNAVKYTPSGSITLAARKWEIYTCIEVTDTGTGFAAEEAALLFTRFYRTKDSAASPGIGLGLYIVRQIAQLQEGYVQAKSLNPGAAFRIFLPNG